MGEAADAGVSVRSSHIIVEVPHVSEETRRVWLEIVRQADLITSKRDKRQQRKMESVFLASLEEEAAKALSKWRDAAAAASKAVVASVVARCVSGCGIGLAAVTRAAKFSSGVVFDPGGMATPCRCSLSHTWASRRQPGGQKSACRLPLRDSEVGNSTTAISSANEC